MDEQRTESSRQNVKGTAGLSKVRPDSRYQTATLGLSDDLRDLSTPRCAHLLKNPSFAVASILTLALGIGLTSAIFSVVYGVMLKPTPYGRPSQVCLIRKSVPKKNLEQDWTSYPTYMDWKRDAASFGELATFVRPDGSVVNLSENDNVDQIQSSKVSSNIFSVLGRPAMLGRTFLPADIGNGARLAVLSYEFWRQRFGSKSQCHRKDAAHRRRAFSSHRSHAAGVCIPSKGVAIVVASQGDAALAAH